MSKLSQFLESIAIPLTIFVAALAVLIWIVARIRARYRESDDPAESTHEMLTQYRELHERGELSKEEFRLIKSQLTNSLTERGQRADDQS